MRTKDLKTGQYYACRRTRYGRSAYRVQYLGLPCSRGEAVVSDDSGRDRQVRVAHLLMPWDAYEAAQAAARAERADYARRHTAYLAARLPDARAIAAQLPPSATGRDYAAQLADGYVTVTLDDLRALVRAAQRGDLVLDGPSNGVVLPPPEEH